MVGFGDYVLICITSLHGRILRRIVEIVTEVEAKQIPWQNYPAMDEDDESLSDRP
jgi:hypothetical protein